MHPKVKLLKQLFCFHRKMIRAELSPFCLSCLVTLQLYWHVGKVWFDGIQQSSLVEFDGREGISLV